ncbi:hypothetical protein [Serratia fonticola]|uniref:hypothetical protein n=1 Tax=Serratia fonticola TaxID=47917 RepID=UPI003AB05BC1
MSNDDYRIVTVNVSQTVGAIPSTLQQTGVIISNGATTLAAKTPTLITSYAEFTAIANDTAATYAAVNAAVTTFFAQGNSLGIYIMEVGAVVDAGIDAVAAYMADPEVRFYTYLVPVAWDGNAKLVTLGRNNAANTSMVYFFIDTDAGPSKYHYKTIKSFVATQKSADPTICNSAAAMWQFISASPSDINKVPPMAFRYLIGVTALVAKGAVKTLLTTNYVNYVGTGAEGGISNTVYFNGMSSDGNDLTYWYSVDWIQINVQMALANEIFNGSNNPINPLYYEQRGIDRLQNRAQSVFNSGVTYGLVNGNPVVGAVPFRTYVKNNPNDYAIGRYAGLSAEYTPMRGFMKIIFNVVVTMQLS